MARKITDRQRLDLLEQEGTFNFYKASKDPDANGKPWRWHKGYANTAKFATIREALDSAITEKQKTRPWTPSPSMPRR